MCAFYCQDASCISYCRLWTNTLKTTVWDGKVAVAAMTVWPWKHLLREGRLHKLMLWWVTFLSVHIRKFKVLTHENRATPLSQTSVAVTCLCRNLLSLWYFSLRNTTVWLGIWGHFYRESFPAFSVTWVCLFPPTDSAGEQSPIHLLSSFFIQTECRAPLNHFLITVWFYITSFTDHPLSNEMASENTHQRETYWESAICPLLAYLFLIPVA